MSFSENLKRARKRAGLSQHGLAAISGVSQQAISTIEKDSRAPTETTMKLLADALGMTVADLIDPGTTAAPSAPSLTIAERQLVDNFRALTREHQADALEHIEYLLYRQSQEKKTTAM